MIKPKLRKSWERRNEKMKKIKKSMVVIAAAGLLAALSACGQSASGTAESESGAQTAQAEKESTQTAQAEEDGVSGSISMVGSTSMEKFANALRESFMQKYPDVSVTAEFVGSGAGVEAVYNGTADIGNASRNLTEEEKAKGVCENIVAIDGIAVITDPSNSAEDLSKEELADIYLGKITNWSELGGENLPIVVIGREAGSGTRSAFEELLEIKDQAKYANELDSTGAVMAKVASTPGAVGYVSLDVLNDSVKALKLAGAEPTEENIQAGSYALSRPFVMATKGSIEEQNAAVRALFDYLHSEEGKQLIASVGLIVPEQ